MDAVFAEFHGLGSLGGGICWGSFCEVLAGEGDSDRFELGEVCLDFGEGFGVVFA